jgi:hypothetical protein
MYIENDEPWTIYSIMEYVSENFISLILLILAFFIIYFVDSINNLNAMTFSPQVSIPQIPIPQIPIPIKINSKKNKRR